jgi:hypothetical protein
MPSDIDALFGGAMEAERKPDPKKSVPSTICGTNPIP